MLFENISVEMAKMDKDEIIMNFRPRICKRVRPQDITLHLKAFDGIISDTKYSSSTEEMESIISNIDKSDVPGKWTIFEDALQIEGYEDICKMINNAEWKDDSEDEQNIKVFAHGIVEKLNVTVELLTDLRTEELINKRCYEEIRKKNEEFGISYAAQMVIDNIHRFKYDWFKIFLRILTKNKQKDLVKKIDPDYEDSNTDTAYDGVSNTDTADDGVSNTDTADDGVSNTDTAYDANQASMPVSSEIIMKEEELYTIAADDKKINCIIYVVARRHILAQNIIKNHLELDKKHKVMIIAPQYSVELQHNLLKKSYNASILINNISEEELKKNEVVLLIPETLKKANLEKSFTYFSLLIIDECHLIIKDYPYDNLMTHYIHTKMDNCGDSLPQIVGMTTLLSHEMPKNIIQADARIEKLCGNVDCEKIYIYQDGINYYSFEVKENELEKVKCLKSGDTETEKKMMAIGLRESADKKSEKKKFLFSEEEFKENPLKEKVNEVMRKIENNLKNSDVAAKIQKEKPTVFAILNADNNKRDGLSYAKWLVDFKNGFTPLTDSEAHQFCYCHWLILNTLHTALEIGTYCEIKPAFEYIEIEHPKGGYSDNIYADLFKYWDEVKPEINTIINKESYQNPQLENVKKYIKEEIMKNEFSRIVVFVKATILVKNIVMWMMNDKELLSLLPIAVQQVKVFGAETSTEMIRAFNSRESQLCVATLEECSLIADKYNLRLDYYDEKDASRKGRFHGNVLQKKVGDGNSNTELFLHNAMIKMKNYSVEDNEMYLKEIRKHLRTAKNQLKKKKKEDSEENCPLNNGEFSIHCKHCNKLACFSSDIRFNGETYFVCTPGFIQKMNVKDKSGHPEYQVARCKSCCKEWGKIIQESVLLPELKISSFNIVDITKNTFNVEQWEFVPFFKYIQKVTEEELERMTDK